ncbi:FkbM family methyltransferase [Flavobacterium sp. CAU 1735]|uniref:FkbM family methyltransferase n=1 Tax=Flavobacterium sp. CAU 1735 TaxID=3140361 RepID=UPI00325FF627
MKYSTIIKQLFVVTKSKWILQFIKGNIYSIASFEVVSNLQKSIPHLDRIIDVGANSGQFSKVANHFYPNASIDSFEPLPNLYPKIEEMFKKNEKIRTHNMALGNENGSIKFNRHKYGHISSILDLSAENVHYPKGENALDQIDVEIKTLDGIFAAELNNKNQTTLLKLDVQGYELEVLRGGTESIKNIDYIVIEANLEQLYKNQPTFTEVNTFLNERSFELAGMLDFNLGKNNKYIEIDLLYQNTLKRK